MTYGQKKVTTGITFKVVLCLHIVVVALILFLGFNDKMPKLVKILPVGLVESLPGPVKKVAAKVVEAAPTVAPKKKTIPKVTKKKIPPKVVKKKVEKKKIPPKVVKKKVKKKKIPPKVVKKKVKKKKIPPKVVKKKKVRPKVVKKKRIKKKKVPAKVVKKRVPKISQAERMAQMRASLKRKTIQKPRVNPSTPTRFDPAAIRKNAASSSPARSGGGVPASYTQSVGQKFIAEWCNFETPLRSNPTEQVLAKVTWNKYGTITKVEITSMSNDAKLNAKATRFLHYMRLRVKLPGFPASMMQPSITKTFSIKVL